MTMSICRNCGVEIADDLRHCPLCGASVDESQNGSGVEIAREPGTAIGRNQARRWLWDVASALMLTGALVVFAADYAFGFRVTWSRFPLLALAYIWIAISVVIFLRRRPALLWLLQTANLLALLLGLSLFTSGVTWFLQLALPLVLAISVLAMAVVAVVRRCSLSFLVALGAGLFAAGTLLVVIELLVTGFRTPDYSVSWSMVGFACGLSLFVLLLIIDRRLRERHEEVRKYFHL